MPVDKAAARPKEKKPKKEIAKTDRVVRQSTQWRTQMTREEDRERQKEVPVTQVREPLPH